MVTYPLYDGGIPLAGFAVRFNRRRLMIKEGIVCLPAGAAALAPISISVRPDHEHPVFVCAYIIEDSNGIPAWHAGRRVCVGAPVSIEGRLLAKLVRITIPPGHHNDPKCWAGEVRIVESLPDDET